MAGSSSRALTAAISASRPMKAVGWAGSLTSEPGPAGDAGSCRQEAQGLGPRALDRLLQRRPFGPAQGQGPGQQVERIAARHPAIVALQVADRALGEIGPLGHLRLGQPGGAPIAAQQHGKRFLGGRLQHDAPSGSYGYWRPGRAPRCRYQRSTRASPLPAPARNPILGRGAANGG